MTNITNTHVYIQADVNVMFTQMQTKKSIDLFGERYIAEMIH